MSLLVHPFWTSDIRHQFDSTTTLIGYFVYTWAKAQDHYNNSKAGHIAALKAAGEWEEASSGGHH
jgi:hypothetical protein